LPLKAGSGVGAGSSGPDVVTVAVTAGVSVAVLVAGGVGEGVEDGPGAGVKVLVGAGVNVAVAASVAVDEAVKAGVAVEAGKGVGLADGCAVTPPIAGKPSLARSNNHRPTQIKAAITSPPPMTTGISHALFG
jgi:hypothetical protein